MSQGQSGLFQIISSGSGGAIKCMGIAVRSPVGNLGKTRDDLLAPCRKLSYISGHLGHTSEL
jgi:hypothetical protein